MAKDQIINFKDSKEIKKQFEEACENNCTTPSHELRLFVRQYLKRNKASRINLSDLNNKRKP